MNEDLKFSDSVYIPERNGTKGFSDSFHYSPMRDILKPALDILVFPKDSRSVIISIPGYNSNTVGDDSVYYNMAVFSRRILHTAVVLCDNIYFKGYNNQELLLEKGRILINYVLDNAQKITGRSNPQIFLMGTSAGGSCCAAIAGEFALVKKILLFNPSGDIPESVMRDSLGSYYEDIITVNGRCDFHVGPRSGSYLSAFASHARSIRHISLPDTGHSFKSAYSKKLVTMIPMLYFSSSYGSFPVKTIEYWYHSLRQMPCIIRHDLFPSLVSIAKTVLSPLFRLLRTIPGTITYLFLLGKITGKRNAFTVSDVLYYYAKIRARPDSVHRSRSRTVNYTKSVHQSIFVSLLNTSSLSRRKDIPVSHKAFLYTFWSGIKSIRVQSFISHVLELLSSHGTLPTAITEYSDTNYFQKLCQKLDRDRKKNTDESLSVFVNHLDLFGYSIIRDQRFWKVVHTFFVNNHSSSVFENFLALIMHQNTRNLQNDYFWLLLDFVLMNNRKPGQLFTTLKNLYRNFGTEVSHPVYVAVHIAVDDMEKMLSLVNALPVKGFISVIKNTIFLEQLLIVSRMTDTSLRDFAFSLLSLFYSHTSSYPLSNEYLRTINSLLYNITELLNRPDMDKERRILLAYAAKVSCQLDDNSFWSDAINNTQKLINTTSHVITETGDLCLLFSFLPVGTDYDSCFFCYIMKFFAVFGKRTITALTDMSSIHLYLLPHCYNERFEQLIITLHVLSYSGKDAESGLLEAFPDFPDIVLRYISHSYKEGKKFFPESVLKSLDFSIIPASTNNIASFLSLISIPLSTECRTKILEYILNASQSVDIEESTLKESFDLLDIHDVIILLKNAPGIIHTTSPMSKEIYKYIFESVISRPDIYHHNEEIYELIKNYSLLFTDSFIIGKFLKQLRIVRTDSRQQSLCACTILKKVVEYFRNNRFRELQNITGIEHARSIIDHLSFVRENLHTAEEYPYHLPETDDISYPPYYVYMGLWRIVKDTALENYLLYGHEISKSESRFTYLGLHRKECFSLPDVSGFMVWVPAYVYNRLMEKNKVNVTLREKSSYEVVLCSDLPAEDIKVYFVHKELYEKNKILFRDFGRLYLSRSGYTYQAAHLADKKNASHPGRRRLYQNIIRHQGISGENFVVIYNGKNTIKTLKKVFERSCIKNTFRQFDQKTILESSLTCYLDKYLKEKRLNLLFLYTYNAFRRGNPVIKKRISRGFNEGYLVTIRGKKYYGKSYENRDRLRAEYIAWLLYREMRIQVKNDVRLLQIGKTFVLAGEWIKAPVYSGQKIPMFDRALDFVMSCLIQDRDQGKYDNYLYVKHSLLPLDFGGSFMFRSTGGHKGDDGQLAFGVRNFVSMSKTGSIHFRKELYSCLGSVPGIIEEAMLRVVKCLSPDIIEQITDAVTFDDILIKKEICSVLYQSHSHLANRLAFFAYRQQKITDIPLHIESVFDILDQSIETDILADETEKRLSGADSVRLLIPNIENLKSILEQLTQVKEIQPGYSMRIRAAGRIICILGKNVLKYGLSDSVLIPLLSRIGGNSYENRAIVFILEHPAFPENVAAICERKNASYLDKAESLHAYIISVLSDVLSASNLETDVFIHDLLCLCVFLLSIRGSSRTEGYKIILRYLYQLSENLFDNEFDL